MAYSWHPSLRCARDEHPWVLGLSPGLLSVSQGSMPTGTQSVPQGLIKSISCNPEGVWGHLHPSRPQWRWASSKGHKSGLWCRDLLVRQWCRGCAAQTSAQKAQLSLIPDTWWCSSQGFFTASMQFPFFNVCITVFCKLAVTRHVQLCVIYVMTTCI